MSLSISFEGKVVLVTGGTSGIGAGTAKLFAELGATVHAVGLGVQQSDEPQHPRSFVRELDVTNADDLERFVQSLERLDVLVNAAGISILGQEHGYEGFRKVMDVNLNAVMDASRLARPLLAENSGAIINIASMYSTFGAADRPAYAASKGAVVQLTKSLAQSYANDGIRVNAIAPGWIDTPLLAPLKADAVISDAILMRTPLRRFGEPTEVARAIAFLGSPLSSFITGTVLAVDGGYLTV